MKNENSLKTLSVTIKEIPIKIREQEKVLTKIYGD
jgi:hypothetical protein